MHEKGLEVYFRDINRYDLLEREQEVALAKRIRQGDEEALAMLVRANLRFVVSVAKRYINQGLMLSDLINEGNIGLLKAAHRFDEERGYRFISY
ncbi:MAG: sigma-70 family RNA polymerase sigma factor, partial [Candidatus Krumholzibacteriia bacterium]